MQRTSLGNFWRLFKPSPLLILLFSITSVTTSHRALAQSDSEMVQLNRRLSDMYRQASTRHDRGGTQQMPGEVSQALGQLQSHGVHVFNQVTELAAASGTSMEEVVLQEHLRNQVNWGMPWLPISWTLEHHDVESEFNTIANQLEATMARNSSPLTDDQVLISYLFVGSVYHSNDGNLIQQIRQEAINVAEADNSFWDIRVEIHNQPSLSTLRDVNSYIQRSTVPQAREIARRLAADLNLLFGNATLTQFLSHFDLSPVQLQALTNAQNMLTRSSQVNSPETAQVFIRDGVVALSNLGTIAMIFSESLRNGASGCNPDRTINCRYENIDLLKMFHTYAFALGSALLDSAVQHQAQLSPQNIVQMAQGLVKSGAAIGLFTVDAVRVLDQIPPVDSNGTTSKTQLLTYLRSVEQQCLMVNRRVLGIFRPVMTIYRSFVPDVDRFADDIVRSSVLIPLASLAGKGIRSIQSSGDLPTIKINDQNVTANTRVLNPGIGRGRLIILSDAETRDPNYAYNSDAIYLLPRTPEHLSRVAGVLTCDSGSIVSHVQLLASNQGIPNVFIPCEILASFAPLAGQEILLIALQNSEVRVTLANSATRQENETWRRYNLVHDSIRQTLHTPATINSQRYPIRLEQLRYSDGGQTAGMKACGQGELTHGLGGERTARGIVLPFGVYHHHIQQGGLQDEIHRMLSSPLIQGNTDNARALRIETLNEIKRRIRGLTIDDEIRNYIRDYISNPQFAGHGFFVRSDTNAEDLPGFVGAGLNETERNVVGLDNILNAVKSVWGSPFKENSFTWRESLLNNPWDVLPSVIIQVAIPSEKSGVMVVGSVDSEDMTDQVLIAANEGVGGSTVGGADAEEILYSRRTQQYQRLRPAYAQHQFVLNPFDQGGGVSTVNVRGLNPLLTDGEIVQLVQLGHRMQRHMQALQGGRLGKWDMEWGIYQGYVVMLQMRPFIGNRIIRDQSLLRPLETPSRTAPQPRIGFIQPLLRLARD